MKWLFLILPGVFIWETSLSQSDSLTLIREVETKLQSHQVEPSALLVDKRYSSLHPLTGFRNLIEKHASATTLIVAGDDEPGKKIQVVATVKNSDGKPVSGALVYAYQTDSRGWYASDAPHVLMNEGDFRHARLFGYVKTDKNGRFELNTIKPAGYPKSDLPAHIHVHVMADGYRPYATEFLFQDDERLKGEILNRAIVDGGMIAIPEPANKPLQQKFTYVLTIKASD